MAESLLILDGLVKEEPEEEEVNTKLLCQEEAVERLRRYSIF